MSITTLSQLGCRMSLAELHVMALLKHNSNINNISHVFYNVSDENKNLSNFVKALGKNHQVFFQSDNTYTPFGRKLSPKYGGDHNYDFLIRSARLNERFLTLHDDSVFKNGFLSVLIDEMNKNEIDFFGFKDTRVLEPYTTVFLDNVPFSDLRIGTWFFAGSRDIYLRRGYSMAEYKYYYRWLINLKYRTARISSVKSRIWLNGGFDVNLKGRLDNYRFLVLDYNKFSDSIVHNEKNTGFFSKRDMLKYADTKEEYYQWSARIKKLVANKNFEKAIFEISFLEKILNEISEYGIEDSFINFTNIYKLKQLCGSF